ncbi:sulfite exporter TauE/SafE family protein [Falsiroseomonas ponticola]|uniref:sulfite exporter TauE/SafE family protein n=1 Tax=Falsiroseomonas ponticola TaxID=2786951 RepID=UPI001932CF38|nr:sulfite exporter TauE/SafE family protein [Roseomonas ponticola]
MEDLGWLGFLALGLIAFGGAVLGGLSGFGAGLIVTPFLVPVVGVKGVVPVMAVAMTFGNLSRAWVYRDQIRPDLILRVLLPSLPGVLVGGLIYDVLPRAPLAALIGSFLLISIPLRRWLDKRKVVPTPIAVIGISFLFGLVAGALPGGGVIVVPLLLGLGLAGGALVGTDAVIGAAVNIAKTLLYGRLDLIDGPLLIGGVLVGLCMIPGAYVARFLIARIHLRIHTALIEVMVAFSGVSFLWSAFT